VRTLVLTSLTMIAFAANSLLTRGALGHDLIDAPSFTIIRLVAGAVMLAVLLQARRSRRPGPAQSGAWLSALWLAGYAVGFTLAYVRIGAGVGALLLFGAVQATMIGVGVVKGERPHVRDWTGLALAMAGLVWLTLPGASAPDLIGAALMIFAGACWGAYSIAGRSSRDPLATTSGNFWRGAIIGAVALGALVAPARITTTGVLLATISGAVTSGLGYAVWYSVIPALGPWRAALVQLTVPILTGLGAVLILGENVSARLAVAAALVTTGVWVSLCKVRGQRKRTN
jgi:drug/metabolite transporter (DMT)-like permease